MPTIIDCPCGKKLKIPDHLAGKKVKCPGCATVIDVQNDTTEGIASPSINDVASPPGDDTMKIPQLMIP